MHQLIIDGGKYGKITVAGTLWTYVGVTWDWNDIIICHTPRFGVFTTPQFPCGVD